MIFVVFKKWFTRIGDDDLLEREVFKKLRKQHPACKMLESFVRMSNLLLQRHFAQKKTFRFFNLPYSKLRSVVDTMLKKYCHPLLLHCRFKTIFTVHQNKPKASHDTIRFEDS